MQNAAVSTYNQAIILFDGRCNFCDAAVNFVFAHDSQGYFKFTPLQSVVGQQLTEKFDLKNIDSVILIEDGRAFVRSTAALRIARRLDGVWAWSYNFIFVPEFIRDFAYRVFARNRYRLFGKKSECALPTTKMRSRFLDVNL